METRIKRSKILKTFLIEIIALFDQRNVESRKNEKGVLKAPQEFGLCQEHCNVLEIQKKLKGHSSCIQRTEANSEEAKLNLIFYNYLS